MTKQPYQLSLERTPGRFTDAEWRVELKARESRNQFYRMQHYNMTHKRPIKRYVKWLNTAGK